MRAVANNPLSTQPLWLLFTLLALVVTCLVFSRTVNADNVIPFTSEHWEVNALEHEWQSHPGRSSLALRGGFVSLKGTSLANAVVEFDVKTDGTRGFAGLMFRAQPTGDYEYFYIRPHQSGNPDANQYTPVFNGVSGWQLYHGAGYSQPMNYLVDEWMHVTIRFEGYDASLSVSGNDDALIVEGLKLPYRNGALALNAAQFSTVTFANFSLKELDPSNAEQLTPPNNSVAQAPAISKWLVSDAFTQTELPSIGPLPTELVSNRQWTTLAAEPTGITNLARVNGIVDGRNTVFARIILRADQAQKIRFTFGYSDFVTVYLNEEALYQGSNLYQSRDYRYLGTIGLHDSVMLPLEPGDNELWLAVTENFGGWGVMGQLDNATGVIIVNPD